MPQSKRHWMDRASDPSTPATEDNETVRTTTYEVNGRYYLVPTIRQGEDGSLYKPEDPLGEALENEDAFIFSSQEEADDMSKQISEHIGKKRQKKYAKGGNVEQMNKLFAEGGMMDDSGEQVNGVEVPPGSLREEVADDIPAQLSEGEFVVPADVVRYIGLEKLMAMRDKAKQGLQRMEEMGQMGNSEEVANPDQTFSEQDDAAFEAEIDDIMAEEGSTMPAGFARGGFASGTDLTKASRNPMVDVRFFKNKEGKVMFITHINGIPLVPIPKGFEPTDESYEKIVGSEADKKAAEEAEKEAEELKRLAALGMGASSSGDGGGGGDSPTTPGVSSDPNDLSGAIEIDPETGQAKGKDFSKYAQLAMAILPAPLALIIQAGAKLSAKQNEEIAKAWNASDKYFNPDAVKGEDKSTGWVSLMKAQESGMGYTVTGTSVSSTKSVQAQNKGLLDEFDLTDEEKAMYAVPTKEDILAQRQEDLDGSIVLGESRARAAARAAAEKEAAEKAAAEKAAAEKAAADRAARAERARAEAAREQARQANLNVQPVYTSSDYNWGSSGDSTSSQPDTGPAGTGATETYGDTSYGTWFAKGGLIKKRPTKPKATKKGLASKRK